MSSSDASSFIRKFFGPILVFVAALFVGCTPCTVGYPHHVYAQSQLLDVAELRASRWPRSPSHLASLQASTRPCLTPSTPRSLKRRRPSGELPPTIHSTRSIKGSHRLLRCDLELRSQRHAGARAAPANRLGPLFSLCAAARTRGVQSVIIDRLSIYGWNFIRAGSQPCGSRCSSGRHRLERFSGNHPGKSPWRPS